jgi:hypothetical protein
LLAGIDLLTGQVHALVKDRHRSREFIEFLKLIDAAYATHTAIKLILDNATSVSNPNRNSRIASRRSSHQARRGSGYGDCGVSGSLVWRMALRGRRRPWRSTDTPIGTTGAT